METAEWYCKNGTCLCTAYEHPFMDPDGETLGCARCGHPRRDHIPNE